MYTSPQFPKEIGLLLCLGGCTLCLGVHLQLFLVNLTKKKKFLRPGGAHAPPGYDYDKPLEMTWLLYCAGHARR